MICTAISFQFINIIIEKNQKHNNRKHAYIQSYNMFSPRKTEPQNCLTSLTALFPQLFSAIIYASFLILTISVSIELHTICITQYTTPNTQLASVPNRITGPAIVKILHQIPNTCPSGCVQERPTFYSFQISIMLYIISNNIHKWLQHSFMCFKIPLHRLFITVLAVQINSCSCLF